MRRLVIVVSVAAFLLGAVGGNALAQNVKAFGGGGPTSFKSATSGSWVKEYWVKAY